ncbi:MAG: acyl-ACP--UDP-N-acetylglucosamine O-acyltransferase [Bacteroidia bacterium]
MYHITLGNRVHIEPNCTLHGEIKIGDDVWLGSNVVIHHGARIGNKCKIHSGAVLSSIPQDLKFVGEESTLIIGDNTTVREFATLNRGTKYRGCTVIGSDCLIMAYTHVAHDCYIGNHVILVNAVNLAGHVEIDDYAVLGGMSAVHQFVKIGKHVMIGGGSLVTKDVPPYITAAREPVQYEGLNLTGLRRRGFSKETISHLQDIYRHLYQEGRNISQALEYIEQNVEDSAEKREILAFCHQATRGLIRG